MLFSKTEYTLKRGVSIMLKEPFNQVDITCPRCGKMMYCKIEEYLKEKFRSWYCENCDLNYRLIPDKTLTLFYKIGDLL